MSHPAIAELQARLLNDAEAAVKSMGTPTTIALVAASAVAAGGSIGLLLSDPTRRAEVSTALSGRVLSVPGTGVSFEFSIQANGVMIGAHLDVGNVMGRVFPDLGFGGQPRSPAPMSGPWQPPPAQRVASGATRDGNPGDQSKKTVQRASGPKAASYSLSMTLPGRRQVRGGWHDIYTQSETVMKFTLDKNTLAVQFSPGLIADVNWPFSDIGIGGGTYDVKSGARTANVWHTQDFASQTAMARESAEGQIGEWIRDLVTGTPLGIRPYDFETDPSPLDTLTQVVGNVGGGGGGAMPESEIMSVSVSATLTLADKISRDTPEGGASIGPGAATAKVVFQGSLADVRDTANRKISSIEINSDSILFNKDGKDVVRVPSVTVAHGGAVTIGEPEVLHEIAGVESLIRLGILIASDDPSAKLLAAALANGIVDRETAKQLSPELLVALVKSKIEQAVNPAIRDAIRQNCLAIPDVNLCEMLGL